MRLTLLRHTPTAVPPNWCHGQSDVALAAGASADIHHCVQHLGDYGLLTNKSGRAIPIYSSPSSRCAALAGALHAAQAAISSALEITYDRRWLELNFGAWENRLWSDIPRSESEPWTDDPMRCCPPGGESGLALIARVRLALSDLLASGREQAIVVTHAGPIRAARLICEQRDLQTFFEPEVAHATPYAVAVTASVLAQARA